MQGTVTETVTMWYFGRLNVELIAEKLHKIANDSFSNTHNQTKYETYLFPDPANRNDNLVPTNG